MATYKVIQDIEAEDKLLGPLSMRQFIYAIIVFAIGGIAFLAAKANVVLAIPFLIPMGFFGLLAAPFGRDQSSEVWLLAKIRFLFKPRKRIWDQSGIKELVTITVPKKVEKYLTDGLDQTQVKSRLSALASTLDSRGWAIKNVTANTFAVPAFAMSSGGGESDRLVSAGAFPQAVANDGALASDDILDERNNPTAQKLDSLITQSEQARRQNLIATMQTAASSPQHQAIQAVPAAINQQATAQPQWYAQAPASPVVQSAPAPVAAQLPTQQITTAAPIAAPLPNEQQLLDKIHQDKAAGLAAQNGHMKRLQTTEEIQAAEAAAAAAKQAEAVRLEELKRLAVNDDLNIATIARQAKQDTNELQILGDGEVVISLH